MANILDVVFVHYYWLLCLGNDLEGGDEVGGGVCWVVCSVCNEIFEVESDVRHGR